MQRFLAFPDKLGSDYQLMAIFQMGAWKKQLPILLLATWEGDYSYVSLWE